MAAIRAVATRVLEQFRVVRRGGTARIGMLRIRRIGDYDNRMIGCEAGSGEVRFGFWWLLVIWRPSPKSR